jgi:hypothetical protein
MFLCAQLLKAQECLFGIAKSGNPWKLWVKGGSRTPIWALYYSEERQSVFYACKALENVCIPQGKKRLEKKQAILNAHSVGAAKA